MSATWTFYRSTRLPFYLLPTISIWTSGNPLSKNVAFIEFMWARSTVRVSIYWNQRLPVSA